MLSPLSPREREVLDCLSRGKTDKQAAQELGVTSGTVKAHVRNIFQKLDVNNRTQAVVKGLREGFVNHEAGARDS